MLFELGYYNNDEVRKGLFEVRWMCESVKNVRQATTRSRTFALHHCLRKKLTAYLWLCRGEKAPLWLCRYEKPSFIYVWINRTGVTEFLIKDSQWGYCHVSGIQRGVMSFWGRTELTFRDHLIEVDVGKPTKAPTEERRTTLSCNFHEKALLFYR